MQEPQQLILHPPQLILVRITEHTMILIFQVQHLPLIQEVVHSTMSRLQVMLPSVVMLLTIIFLLPETPPLIVLPHTIT